MSSPGVIFLHGVRASRRMWDEQLRLLDTRGIPARAIDLPAHGSRRSEEFTIPAAMAAIDEAAAATPGGVVVVGSSLGGYLGIHWAGRTRHPVRAVLAAGATTSTSGLLGFVYEQGSRAIGRLPDGGAWLGNAANRLTTPAYVPTLGPDDVPSITEMAGVVHQMRGLSVPADIARIHVPVWFVNGRWDHFRWHERRFLRAAHHGELRVIPQANHLVSLTNPTAFNAVLVEMLQQISPGEVPDPHAANQRHRVGNDAHAVTQPGHQRGR